MDYAALEAAARRVAELGEQLDAKELRWLELDEQRPEK